MPLLFHGHSFTANPVAFSAALASPDLLLSDSTQRNIQRICMQHQAFVQKTNAYTDRLAARQCGIILATEWKTEEATSYFSSIQALLSNCFLDHHISVRPLGNVPYFMPTYCISEEDLDYIFDLIFDALNATNA